MKKSMFAVEAVISFPSLFETDDNGKYSVQLCNLSDAAVERLKALGVPVKFKDDDKYGRGEYINTSSNYAYKVTMDGVDMKGASIGYGSRVRATLTTYDWEYRGKSGTSARVEKLEILELVETETDIPDDLETL